ncbi:DUF4054 domain-containing protein [Xenorhabdus bovienii]|uniref:DUF4054 domain-containing protein n=1 Tax=Xenorhabdus bovienii TaxID=40576 RepID=UPI000690A0D8|nr:DUF4054 domain-containing protein [Xenorhabdus bovienii]
MISDGFSPSAQKRTDKKLSDKSNTFSAYAELYFENAKFADSTRKMKMSVLEREIVTVLGRYLMTEINTVIVRDLCEKIKLRGARAASSATEGSVSVSFAVPDVANSSWFKTTPCRQMYWQATRKYVVGGRYSAVKHYHPWG